MRYLVTMKVIEAAIPHSPEQVVSYLEQMALPYVETLKKLEEEKKILAGGGPIGKRASVFIVDVASNEELDQLLMSLPMWNMMEVEVTPLRTFEAGAAQTRQSLERFKRA